MFSSHVPVEKGHPQVPAGRLAAEARLLPHRGYAPAALAPDLEGMGSAQVEGVLAVLAAQGIGGLVEAPDLVRPQKVLEEGVLDEMIRRQIEEDHPRGAVRNPVLVEAVEEIPEQAPELDGIARGATELRLAPRSGEGLLSQEGDDFPWGKTVAPRFDAGRFEVPEELGR